MNDRKGKPWRGTLQYKDENGKWHQKTRVFNGIHYKREAQVMLDEWRAQLEAEAKRQESEAARTEAGLTSKCATVQDAILEFLRHQHQLGILALGTYQKQVAQAEHGIFPHIGECPVGQLSSEQMARYIEELSCSKKPSTVRNLYSIVNKTYRDLVRRGLIDSNPCSSVNLPRSEQAAINYLDSAGREKFFIELEQLPEFCTLRIAATLAFYTGMRAGEICALQWRDVDFGNSSLRVSKGARRVKDDDGSNVVVIGRPKTATGRRTIPLLRQAKEALLALYRSKGGEARESDFILGSENDPTLICGNFLAWSKRRDIIGRAGKPITMHSLRHTFATIGVQSGMDVKSLASILGHSRADMTLNTYASDDEEAKRVAMSNLENMLEG